MLTNNSDLKTNIPIWLIKTSTPVKRRKIANIDLFRDNDDDDDTTVVIFIAFIFSYLLIYFVLKHIYISLGNNTWIIATIIAKFDTSSSCPFIKTKSITKTTSIKSTTSKAAAIVPRVVIPSIP